MNKAALCATTAVLAIMSVSSPARAGHPEWYPVAGWEMNERASATVLRDASGNGFTGTIGKRVTPNKKFHSFPREDHDGVYPQHVNVVPDNDALDPGFADFGIIVRFRWGNNRHDQNLVQKGQGSPAGGMVKVKTTVPVTGQPPGHIKCLFRGSTGDSQVESYSGPTLNDGRWHTVRCERTNDGTVMFVDGVLRDTNDNQPGNISNDWPVAIGGNTKCEDTETENNICNYWFGEIGFVRWMKR